MRCHAEVLAIVCCISCALSGHAPKRRHSAMEQPMTWKAVLVYVNEQRMLPSIVTVTHLTVIMITIIMLRTTSITITTTAVIINIIFMKVIIIIIMIVMTKIAVGCGHEHARPCFVAPCSPGIWC